VPNPPVTTDKDGYARVPYPKYVFERIETGTLCLQVNHPDFVPELPERMVATAPPAGAPWRVRLDNLWNRIRHRILVARPGPIVLSRGAVLKISVGPNSPLLRNAPLFAQVSGQAYAGTFWIRPEPGVVVTRRLGAGPQKVRAVQFDTNGWAWFSDVISITGVAAQTNEIVTDLKRGVAVRGQLDARVPRPVTNGRIVVHVWPQGEKPEESPPQWHAWTTIREDGAFDVGPLPEGNLEIVALCNGFVSTNGPGQFPRMHYPQKHVLGTNDIQITVSMEPTACLEVQVLDDRGNCLKDARVSTWPNVRYGEWAATVLASDRYNMADRMRDETDAKSGVWWQSVPDFNATSDGSGLAVLRNLPVEVNELAVEHPRFALPAVVTAGGDKRRQATIMLQAGQTNHVVIRLEPREQSPIRHY